MSNAEATLNYSFLEELAGQPEEIFVRLPLNQPSYARKLSGKVISARKLPGMVVHAIGLAKCEADDHLAAQNEATMVKQGQAAHLHFQLHGVYSRQAKRRAARGQNLLRSILEAEILV